MAQIDQDELQRALEKLAGQTAPFETKSPTKALSNLAPDGAGIGHSQLNELLLLFGFDRVTSSFFQYLVDGTASYRTGATVRSLSHLLEGIDRFRQVALLFYGNIKYAFKTLSRDADLLQEILSTLEPVDVLEFEKRHDPILPILPIAGTEAYYTGYIVESELKKRLASNPSDVEAQDAEKARIRTVERAKANHEAYLASDHLDVYVATSMRERHEFMAINRVTGEIFGHSELAPLKLRWFDPTQAYCKERVDKGLSEALMLRRAQCTIYFAQESDTLGKDSELASTLAQGKTVIASANCR